MTIKIYVQGIGHIEAPAGELAEVLRQIRELNSTPEQRVPASETPASTPAPAPRPPRAADIWPMPTATPAPAIISITAALPPLQPPSSTDTGKALNFLQSIERHHSAGGITGAQLAHVMGLSHAKGVGSRSTLINKIIAGLGFAIEDVYRNPRDSVGVRHWLAGPKLKEAIAAIEKEVAGA